MAERGGREFDSSEKSKNEEVYDPTLDFYSEYFDPIKALNTPGVIPPVPSAKIYDNLAKYESVVCKQISADPAKRGGGAEPATSCGRKWLPHQLPVPSKPKTLKEKKNIFAKMETENGPLKLLKECIDKRLQIKVITRYSYGIRGFCIGYITLYDKHLNMTLEDVLEEWTRPKRRKIPALGENCAKLKVSRKILQIPEVVVVRSDKKTETCQRRLKGVLLRGEDVVCVIVLRKE